MKRSFPSRRALLAAAPAATLALAANAPQPEAWTLRIDSFDGVRIAYRSIGIGKPLLMLHGLFSSGTANWIVPGIADRLGRMRRRVILPDFRGHGLSDKPEDAAAYPPDALAMDIEALLAALEVTDCDIAGYSLGARIAVRLVDRGLRPGKLALCGMGLEGITNLTRRRAHFEDLIINGENSRNPAAAALVARFMDQMNMSDQVALNVLATQLDTPADRLALIEAQTRVICGDQDRDNGDPAALAAAIPGATLEQPPGEHLSTVSAPEFSDALVRFFADE
jgi:pimeloyl-ACP methyl ester carboxylesterase